jgi:amidase
VCGIVGIKPTVGLISRSGLIPISTSQDTAGAMARTVRDAALLLGALAGTDPQDPATLAHGMQPAPDFAAATHPHALKGARLGVITGPFGFDPTLNTQLNHEVAELKAAGAEIAYWGEFPTFLGLDDPEREVLLYEFKDGINRYLATLGPTSAIKSLADLIAYNQAHAAAEMPYFNQQIFVRAQAKGPLTEPAYRAAVEACRRIARTQGIDILMKEYRLDALVSLTGSVAWRIDRVSGGLTVVNSAQPAAVAGYPSVSVPAAQIDGLPVGLSFYGRPWSESRLLDLAADFESRTRARRVPQFLPHAAVAAPAAPERTRDSRSLLWFQ